MGGCEPPCGFRDLNSGPSEEQSVLLPAEPSRQSKTTFSKGQIH
ncbi:mCG1050994 [Mus musculus]|nr:mCG1050994 [Mus musculus]